MNDENARVPFEKSASNVTPIRGDNFATNAFSADEVADTLNSLDRLIQAYGFDNVALNVADALIHLRVRMDTEYVTVGEDVEVHLVDLEQKVRDFNGKRLTGDTQP